MTAAEAERTTKPLALVALTDEERTTIAFAAGAFELLSTDKDLPVKVRAEYTRQKGILTRLADRAREARAHHP